MDNPPIRSALFVQPVQSEVIGGDIAGITLVLAVQAQVLGIGGSEGVMAVKARERYRVDLIGLQAACEANYARLMRLLPDMRHAPEARRIGVTHGDRSTAGITTFG